MPFCAQNLRDRAGPETQIFPLDLAQYCDPRGLEPVRFGRARNQKNPYMDPNIYPKAVTLGAQNTRNLAGPESKKTP